MEAQAENRRSETKGERIEKQKSNPWEESHVNVETGKVSRVRKHGLGDVHREKRAAILAT